MTHVAFMRRAFLHPSAQRYAVMLTAVEAARRDQKYHEYTGTLTDVQVRAHLAGTLTLATPAAVDDTTALLPLDVDGGGLPALRALLVAAAQRNLWAFGQYCPRSHLPNDQQRGYVWIPFAALASSDRVQLLGEQLIGAVQQPDWDIESRAHAAVTRLPLARHTHTRHFGELLLHDQRWVIDDDPAAAWQRLHDAYHANDAALLPQLPPLPAPAPETTTQHRDQQTGITINHYNHDTDLVTLLEHYGARRARGSRRLLHCCGHDDIRRASLLLWENRTGKLHCKCLSQHHGCPLAGQMRDAFGVYCAMEQLTDAEALRQLNGHAARSRC